MRLDYADLYGDLFLPVIVCGNMRDFPVKYMNAEAQLLFVSPHTELQPAQQPYVGMFNDWLRMNPHDFGALCGVAGSLGHVDDYACEIAVRGGQAIQASISGTRVIDSLHGDYFVFYIVAGAGGRYAGYADKLVAIMHAAFLSEGASAAINTVLALTGRQCGASRVYIVEETPSAACNTYEWCASGIEPAGHTLRDLKPREYHPGVTAESGIYVTADVSALPAAEREMMEAQGVKARAVVTLYDNRTLLGYVGLDDCTSARTWENDRMRFLKGISALLAALIRRRNAEKGAADGMSILQLIVDNSEEITYVNRLDDYSLVFVSKVLCRTIGKGPEELLGKKCWQVLQAGQSGPCSFCPIPHIEWGEDKTRSEVYAWQLQNTVTQKRYIAKDNILKWVDGAYVHVETATDISQWTDYEKQLRYLASTDVMTGVSNREWGSARLKEKFDQSAGGSLCFLDIDGLKMTNDMHGHAAGDKLLVETVRIVMGHLRPDEIMCRWGGDEFLIWLERDVAGADAMMRAVGQELERYNQTEDRPFKLAFSYGAVPFETPPAATLDTLVTAADQLMYKRKMEKRGLLKRRRRDDSLES